MKHIGILTSGGDSPGMNAAVRAAVFAARAQGITLYGIQQGYRGLYEGNWDELTLDKVDAIHAQGGTILRTARFMPFQDSARRQPAIDQCVANCAGKIDGLIVIGGDGSFRGAQDLTNHGLPCVCLPGTIDNDIACTDYTIGYDTALNTVMNQVDAIADTARSHDRCMIIEVMGNKAGDLTLYGGIACGATAVVLMEHGGYRFPEEGEMDAETKARFESDLVARVLKAKAAGKNYFLIFVAEGITGKKDKNGKTRYPGGAEALAKALGDATGADARCDILSYVQRGGRPTARDRVIATQMGDYAVGLLARGISNRVVVIHNEVIMDYDINQALKMPKGLSAADYGLAWRVSL
ncbi:MAG: ATP-dependent 6-phosphofructokinase [Oscillospiraceae bacterium]|jgi:6-phosphofructokinase 1|nr:ATP-dependent 6-phosphofructokinase [Oscillospiraceae bacterium]